VNAPTLQGCPEPSELEALRDLKAAVEVWLVYGGSDFTVRQMLDRATRARQREART
jgi:hypothetical protein